MTALLHRRLIRLLCLACFVTVLLALIALIDSACGQTDAAGAVSSAELDAPTRDLLRRRIAALRADIAAIESQITKLRQRMPQIEKKIDQLTDEVGSIKLPDPEEDTEEPPEKKAQAVAFGSPIVETVKDKDVKTPLALICEEGRVSILDLEKQSEEFNKIANNKNTLQHFVRSGGGKLDAGDFEVVMTVVILGSRVLISQVATRKPGHNGESLQMAIQPSSRLRKRLSQLDAGKSVIQFAVYPDSFNTFREIRKTIWHRDRLSSYSFPSYSAVRWMGMGSQCSPCLCRPRHQTRRMQLLRSQAAPPTC